MIKLTRLDGREFIVNAELIETFEATPETVITLTLDKRFVVRETVDEVMDLIIRYKRLVFSEWPLKDKLHIPSTESQFGWIETEGLAAVDKLDPQALQEYEKRMGDTSPPQDSAES